MRLIFTRKERWARQKRLGSRLSSSSSNVRQFDCPSIPLMPLVTTLMMPSSIDAKQMSLWLTRNNRPPAFRRILEVCGFCDSSMRTSVSNFSDDGPVLDPSFVWLFELTERRESCQKV